MTLPNERTRAVHNTREFLRSLLDPKKTPRVPKEVRKQAYWCLKHFPSDYDMEYASKDYLKIFGPVFLENEYDLERVPKKN